MSQETDQQILDALREIRDGRREIIAALAASLMLVHAAVSVAAGADPDRRTERVRFAAGATSTSVALAAPSRSTRPTARRRR